MTDDISVHALGNVDLPAEELHVGKKFRELGKQVENIDCKTRSPSDRESIKWQHITTKNYVHFQNILLS